MSETTYLPPVVGLCLAVRPVVARRVGVALPVVGGGASVGRTGPPSDGQRAVWKREGEPQAGQVAVAPLEGLDALQAVGAAGRLIAGPIEPVLRLWPAHAALRQAVLLRRLVSLLLHADGRGARRGALRRVFGVADGLGRFAAAQELLAAAAGLLQGLGAAEGLLRGQGDPVSFGCLT